MFEKTKEEIKEAYINACNDYVHKLMEIWNILDEDEEVDYSWWVGDEVGGVFCCDDDMFIDMNDIVYCVDNDVDHETYSNYIEYITKCEEYGFNTINLNAFVKGAPRVSDEEFRKLGEIKQQLYDTIEETKKKY